VKWCLRGTLHSAKDGGATTPTKEEYPMKIAAFLQDLAGGGAERVAITLLNELAETHDVSLVLARNEGPYLADVSGRIESIDLAAGTTMQAIPKLAQWIRANRPEILMTHLTHVNVAGALAVRLSRMPVQQVAVEHNQMGLNYERIKRKTVRLAYQAARYIYPGIPAIVSVSAGVEASVARFTRITGQNCRVIANPVLTPHLRKLMDEHPVHPWLSDGGDPVILGCGRLVEQKDFANLIAAFAQVRQNRRVRLLILGEGDLREPLQRQINEAGLTEVALLAGFDRNPYAAMRAARLFVLSSRWEGLPTVLIEALATGVNVVSTNCPSGPDEVLDEGRFGALVPIADATALARGIQTALDAPIAPDILKERAEHYSLERATARYEDLFRALIAGELAQA
jgi:glycosyltransferase involved in cell wall biosynthesis